MVNWNLVGAMVLPNVGGWLGSFSMMDQVKKPDGTAWYQVIKKPTWTPPDWVFGPAWTTLYVTMGGASYMVVKECGGFNGKGSHYSY
jgi:tryptophan-rich sensory protein